jgi:hypothetical protein
MEVPKTHDAFMGLLNGLDLTTASGVSAYESLTALAPAFVSINGTAQQAADRAQALSEALAELDDYITALNPSDLAALGEAFGDVGSAIDALAFITDNFYTDAQKLTRAQNDLDSGFAKLGKSVPKTHEEFLNLLGSLDLTTDAGRLMYAEIAKLAPLFVKVKGAAEDAAQAIVQLTTDLGAIGGVVTSEFDRLTGNIESLISSMTGDLGVKLAAQLRLIKSARDRVLEQMAALEMAGGGGTDQWQALQELADRLAAFNDSTAAELAKFITLSAKYDAERAAQIIELDKWRDEMLKLFAVGSAGYLLVLEEYNKKLQEIVNGTGTSIGNVLEQLKKLRAGLRDWLKGLSLSNLSPLTPEQKFFEAQRQYMDLLKKAQGGDVEAMWKRRDAQVPMGHQGDAWDVAYAALYLVSDEAKYVTGIELVVDGGITQKYA